MALGDRIDGGRAEPVGRYESWYVFAGADIRGVEIRRSTGSKPLAHVTSAGARELAALLVAAAGAAERLRAADSTLKPASTKGTCV